MAILRARAVRRTTVVARRLEVEPVRLDAGRRVAAAAVLLLAGVLFVTPPAVALLVLVGVIR